MIPTNFQQHPSKIQVLQRPQSQLPINLPSSFQQQKYEYINIQQQKIAKQPVRQTLQYQINPHINQLQFQQGNLVQQTQLGQQITYYPNVQSIQRTKFVQKNINQQNNEMIQQKNDKQKQKQIFDFNVSLLEIKPLYKQVKLFPNKAQYLPGILSIKVEDQAIIKDPENVYYGIDLVCLIDISASMIGGKIHMVKQSLIVLLQSLGVQDRLQLIIFDDYAHSLTPLINVTKQNKIYFTYIIQQIEANGGNCILEAIKMAFCQLKNREHKQYQTLIFLFSDGIGFTFPEIKEQIKTFQEVFPLHTFGFGQDHDARMMTQISDLTCGSFYFVQDLIFLDEYFQDALGGVHSVFGEELEITITSQASPPYQNIQIFKIYDDRCQKKGNQYYIRYNIIPLETRIDFVFELALPKFQGRVQDYPRSIGVLFAELKIKDFTDGYTITKRASLDLNLFNFDEQITENIYPDLYVYTRYFRAKGTEVIDEAIKAFEQNKKEDAYKLIDNLLIQIQKNPDVAALCTRIIQDLQKAKQASARSSFSCDAQRYFLEMDSNNYQNEGFNSMFSNQGIPFQENQPAAYQNIQQQQMMVQMQKQKPNCMQY
ncbi:unnamed protein product [Paramecium primaurelia]|uniref:VWFA domain-containing protein n=1 Tax=Paramecium primaurelia TaxID=5886 RepID=A0A8S1PJZ8_PARPR|nr:unnamed protein product [Paramecium primaurelia]